MASGTGALVAAHVICTTLGYGSLIISNLWLAFIARAADPSALAAAVRSTLTVNRLFGPLLGLGLLLGIATLAVMRIPGQSPWLLASYGFIVLALVLQAAVAIPWHVRLLRALAAGENAAAAHARRTGALVAAGFAVPFVSIVTLMVMRPYAL